MIQEEYHRFRQWQQQPFDYQDTDDHHGCCNCGNEYENNYCPRCGQKAVYGPITWRSVFQGVMDVWGVGTRSLPYSLWQLIWRPGYLIRDYISGKRQASFPPVKMLVVVALVLVMVNNMLSVDYANDEPIEVAAGSAAFNAKFDVLFDWMTNHIAWSALIAFSLFIIPIWFLFRQAPRLPRHVLPQGFYIQVFIGVQFLMFMLMTVMVVEFIPSLQWNGSNASGIMVFIVLPVMLLVDYKQLFGYGWWGTIWRALVAIPLMLFCGKTILYMMGSVYCLCTKDWHNMTSYLMNALEFMAIIWLMAEIVHLINNKPWRDGVSVKMFLRPFLALVAMLLTFEVCSGLGFRTPIDMLKDMFES